MGADDFAMADLLFEPDDFDWDGFGDEELEEIMDEAEWMTDMEVEVMDLDTFDAME
jgi:hypothetical protein